MRFRRALDRGNVTEALSSASELEHVGRSLNSSDGGGASSDALRFLSAGRGSILDSLGKQ